MKGKDGCWGNLFSSLFYVVAGCLLSPQSDLLRAHLSFVLVLFLPFLLCYSLSLYPLSSRLCVDVCFWRAVHFISRLVVVFANRQKPKPKSKTQQES